MTSTTLDISAVAVALDAARHLAEHGVPVFIARPALDEDGNWNPAGGHNGCGYWLPGGWQTTAPDPATVDTWRPGDALAAVMGKAVDGADVDPRNGGQESAEQLQAAGCWPRSYGRQVTPSGGWHDLIAPLGVASRDLVMPGLDVKAGHDGHGHGFLFIAPTVKLSKATGELSVYTWTTPPDLTELDERDDTGDALAARIGALRATEAKAAPEVPHDAYDAMPEHKQAAVGRYLAATVERIKDELTEAATWPEGYRQVRMVPSAGGAEVESARGWQKLLADTCNRLGRLARADWTPWTYADAHTALVAVVPPAMAAAVGLEDTWHAQRARRSPAAYPVSLDADDWTRDLVVRDLGDLGVLDVTTAQERAVSAAAALDDEDGEDADARARRLFPRLDWHELWSDDTVEEWIHEPLLPARRSVVVYSPPKVGKSLLVLELAVAVSRGETFLNYAIERRYRVLYVDFENDPRGDVRSRLQAMGYGPDDLDHLDYLSFPTMAGLDTDRGATELLAAVRAYGSEVVVIDTVSRAVDGEENSNDTWLGLYRRTGLRLKQAGVALIRLDHTGKDESRGQRGGSAKAGDVDAIWKLSRITDERFRLECTDARLVIDTKSLHLTRHRLPRLHHTVEVLSAMTDHEAKVAHLIALANANGLPSDANRETLREFAAGRGIKAAGRVIQDVIRARKSELSQEFTPSAAQVNDPPRSPSSPAPQNADSEHETGELTPRVQQSSPPPGEVNSHPPHPEGGGEFTPFTCLGCGQPLGHSDLIESATHHPDCGGPQR